MVWVWGSYALPIRFENKREANMERDMGLWKPEEFEKWARYYDPDDVFRDINARFK